MDPVMRATQAFLDEADARWKRHPDRILPLVGEESARGDMVKALRLAELAPQNRRPLFVFEAPFLDVNSYFAGLIDSIVHDYDAVRAGVGEEGVALPPLDLGRAGGVVERAALAIERAATSLGTVLEGATVALLPTRVHDADGWRESVRALDWVRWSGRVRVAAYAPPGGPLDGIFTDRQGARFSLDLGDLLRMLRELGEPSRGPAFSGTPEAAAGSALRDVLLEAAALVVTSGIEEATGPYERAASICAREGLGEQEAMMRLALGGLYTATERVELAIESYAKAAGLAEAVEAWSLACQSWFGVGGVHVARENYGAAVLAYQAAEVAASKAELSLLRIEALRLAGTCLLASGSDTAAALAWLAALNIGVALPELGQRASTLSEVVRALSDLGVPQHPGAPHEVELAPGTHGRPHKPLVLPAR
jgi:hypothetical protein